MVSRECQGKRQAAPSGAPRLLSTVRDSGANHGVPKFDAALLSIKLQPREETP